MTPLIVLLSVFLVLTLASRLGATRLHDWVLRIRIALAAMFLLTGAAHFGAFREDLVRMVPPWLPDPEFMVTLTGVAEITGAIGLLVPRIAPLAALALATLLVAMFPANVHAANAGLTIDGAAVLGVVPRGLLQLVFLASAIAAGLGHRLARVAAGTSPSRPAHPTGI